MDKPTWKPHDGYSGTDLHDDYAEAWEYIEHLEARLGRASAVAKGSLRSLSEHANRIDEAMTKVRELEAMLGAGNLCEGQHVLRKGDDADTAFRMCSAYTSFTVDDKHYRQCLPVLIEDKAGVAVWRFYRRAGH